MATKIEILAISPNTASLALYYVVASPIAAANDQTRIPAGTQVNVALDGTVTTGPKMSRLSPTEEQAFKNGTLFELVKTVSLSGMNKAQAKARIEATWAERQTEANRTYRRTYRDRALVGKAFDGSTWS